MRILFMGTPDFATASLQALLGSEHKVLAAFTQPDKPKGRKGIHAHAAAYDGGVYHGIELLEDVAEHQRQGERKQQRQGFALGHVEIFGHTDVSCIKESRASRLGFGWHPLRESNSQLTLRRGLLYPFN